MNRTHRGLVLLGVTPLVIVTGITLKLRGFESPGPEIIGLFVAVWIGGAIFGSALAEWTFHRFVRPKIVAFVSTDLLDATEKGFAEAATYLDEVSCVDADAGAYARLIRERAKLRTVLRGILNQADEIERRSKS